MQLLNKPTTLSDISCIMLTILPLAIIFCSLASVENMASREKSVFTTVVYPTQWSETNTLLLVESIRNFGGALAQNPIWCLVPQYGKQLSANFKDRIIKLDVTILPFEIDSDVVRFFFAGDIRAAALAESLAIGQTDLLIWLSSNTIVLQEPTAFVLPHERSLGYRPVHHINIGSPCDEDPDVFWTLIYQYCKVPKDRIFPMQTHVDDLTIRPYFNAGIIVTRPEKQLFKAWRDVFFEVYQNPKVQEIYQQDKRYTIFIHQAILSGTILATFTLEDLYELPRTYNYPIHLHADDATAHRPTCLDDLVTIRHEGFYQDPNWKQTMPASDSLKEWLAEKLRQ